MSTQHVDRAVEELCATTGEPEAPPHELADAGSRRTPFYLSVQDQRELERVAESPDAVLRIAGTLERAHRALRRQMVLAGGLIVFVFAFAMSSSVVSEQPAAGALDVLFIVLVLAGSAWWIRQERDQGWDVRAVSVMLKTIRVLDDPDTSLLRRSRAIDAAAATFYRAFRVDRRSWLHLVGVRAPRAYRLEQRTSAELCALAIASQGRRILEDPANPHAAADALRQAVLDASSAHWRRVESVGICEDLPPLWRSPGWLARAATAVGREQLWRPIGGLAAVLTITTLTINLFR